MINNFSSFKRDERTPLGFSNTHNNYAFMEPYHGVIGTDKVDAVHPWAAGVKIGLSIWPGKTDKEKKKQEKMSGSPEAKTDDRSRWPSLFLSWKSPTTS